MASTGGVHRFDAVWLLPRVRHASWCAPWLLVSQLGGSLAEQQAAAGSLRHVARFAEARQAMVACGGVAALVATAQVKGLDAHGLQEACLAVAALSCAPHSEAVAAAGGAEVLIEAVRRDGGCAACGSGRAAGPGLASTPARQARRGPASEAPGNVGDSRSSCRSGASTDRRVHDLAP